MQQLSQTRHLGALFESRGCTLTDVPSLTSAHSGRLEQFSGPGWLAIGDAAMSFDPITGHGLLKAMQSAMQSVQTIAAGHAEARATFDTWNDQLWQQFSQARRQCYATERRWGTAPFWHSRN